MIVKGPTTQVNLQYLNSEEAGVSVQEEACCILNQKRKQTDGPIHLHSPAIARNTFSWTPP